MAITGVPKEFIGVMRMGDTHDGTEVMWVQQDTSEMKVKLPQVLELTDPKIGGSNRAKAMSMGPLCPH